MHNYYLMVQLFELSEFFLPEELKLLFLLHLDKFILSKHLI